MNRFVDIHYTQTQSEEAAELALRLENFERYKQQSTETTGGKPAVIPPRPKLYPFCFITDNNGDNTHE